MLSDLVDCLLRYQCPIAIKYCISVVIDFMIMNNYRTMNCVDLIMSLRYIFNFVPFLFNLVF